MTYILKDDTPAGTCPLCGGQMVVESRNGRVSPVAECKRCGHVREVPNAV